MRTDYREIAPHAGKDKLLWIFLNAVLLRNDFKWYKKIKGYKRKDWIVIIPGEKTIIYPDNIALAIWNLDWNKEYRENTKEFVWLIVLWGIINRIFNLD